MEWEEIKNGISEEYLEYEIPKCFVTKISQKYLELQTILIVRE